MKTSNGSRWNFRKFLFSSLTHLTRLTFLTAFVLPLAGCLQESSLSPDEAVAAATEPSAPPEAPEAIAETPIESDPDDTLAAVDEQSISNAPVKKVSTEIEVPSNLRPSAATAEIIKLANSGVEESVMLTFVTNSLGTFNLRAEEIIYLNDIGIPPTVITAMIQRDHLLQGASANLTMTPSEPEPSIPAPAPAYQPGAAEFPAPVADSAQPDYASDSYTPPVEPAEPVPADYSDYYDVLAPYGNWVDVAGVGRCWQPTVVVVNRGWRPYFNCGRWVYTDCGWYWMSDYSWGWAPFHYGRWFQHASLGWCWSPDRVWGPSWVCWRQSGDFCGWAPLPPGCRFIAGVGLTFHGHPVRHNFSFGLGSDHFRFIHARYFMDRDLARHVLPVDHSARIFDRSLASTGIISHNHRVSNNGIPREHVASATHANIVPVTLHNVSPSTGVALRERFERNGRTLTVFRPDAQQRIPIISSTAFRENRPTGNQGIALQNAPTHDRLANVQSSPVLRSGPDERVPSRTTQPAIGSIGSASSHPRTTQPLILQGSHNSRETAATATTPKPQNTRHSVPLNSLVVIGQHRDSRVAAAQPDTHSSWNSHNRPSHTYDRNFRNQPQVAAREDDSRPEVTRPQTAPQPNWWAQPQQPRNANQDQFRHNREMPGHATGHWNAGVESSRYNPTPTRVPEHTRSAPIENRQSHPTPSESRPSHNVPMESHQSRPAQSESHQSHSAPAATQPSHAAPAPAPSSPSSSSSHDTSSHSSGRGR